MALYCAEAPFKEKAVSFTVIFIWYYGNKSWAMSKELHCYYVTFKTCIVILSKEWIFLNVFVFVISRKKVLRVPEKLLFPTADPKIRKWHPTWLKGNPFISKSWSVEPWRRQHGGRADEAFFLRFSKGKSLRCWSNAFPVPWWRLFIYFTFLIIFFNFVK